MRTPLWETSAGALMALLNSGAPLNKADLYTLTLGNGTVYRWSGFDAPLVGNGNLYTLGPGIDRTKVSFTIGVSVDDMIVTLTDIVGTTINGVPLAAFVRAGGLIGARLQVDKAFWGASSTAPVGAFMWFAGKVADATGDRFSAQLTVKSDADLFATMIPRDVYQAGCLNTIYDGKCALARASFTATNAATSISTPTRITFNHTLAQVAGYFDLGTITMTSGLNAGLSRTVKSHLTGSITVLSPWPFAVAVSDTFSVVPGCDHTQTTCTTKFSNVIHFRGQPYIPVPVTVL